MAPQNRPPLPKGPYLVVGLARSGVSAALALRRADPALPVRACDSSDSPELRAATQRLGEAGVEVILNTDGVDLLTSPDPPRAVVKSPGVPAQAPAVVEARERGLPVLGELELGWRLLPNPFCAVTGTNGKTTTTEMIGAIYREAGQPAAVAGNVGVPVSSLYGELDSQATVVCEASSFQLEDAVAFRPDVGVLLNLAVDHLDRHESFDQYLASKLRLFAQQRFSDVAVLNADDPHISPSPIPGEAQRLWFGASEGCDLLLKEGELHWRGRSLMDVAKLSLPGPHNVENAMAAACATLVSGISRDAVAGALSNFAAVPHRLERVASLAGVDFVNDSKATNVAAAAAALRSFKPGTVHAILGGSLKGDDFAQLAPIVEQQCLACYLIGQAADRLAADLGDTGVELIECKTLERALGSAAAHARDGEVILLAPACASFDQFDDYEHRGEEFRRLVHALEKPA